MFSREELVSYNLFVPPFVALPCFMQQFLCFPFLCLFIWCTLGYYLCSFFLNKILTINQIKKLSFIWLLLDIIIQQNQQLLLLRKYISLTLRSVAQRVRSWVCSQRSPVQVPQTSRPLETYMVVNFRARGISRGARKLAWTPTLI